MKQSIAIKCITITFFLFFGCNAQENKKQEESSNPFNPVIIDVTQLKETNPIRISQFADSISYIFLSETDYVFSRDFSKIMVDDDTLFLIKPDNVYKYTPEGVFIIKVIDVKHNNRSDLIYTYAAYNKKERFFTFRSNTRIVRKSITHGLFEDYLNFSFDGIFLNETDFYLDNKNYYKLIDSYFDDYRLYRKDTIIETFDSLGNRLEPGNTMINRLGPFLFYAETVNSNDIFYSYPNPAATDHYVFLFKSDVVPGNMIFIPVDSVLWFKHYALDTLYVTQDFLTVVPKFIFKTDNSFMNIHEYTQLKNGALDSEKKDKLNILPGFLPLQSTGELLYVLNRNIAIADNTGHTYGFSSNPILNDLDDYLKDIDISTYLVNRLYYIENNNLYLIIAANQFFKEGCKPPNDKIINDNSPVVLKIKLKS